MWAHIALASSRRGGKDPTQESKATTRTCQKVRTGRAKPKACPKPKADTGPPKPQHFFNWAQHFLPGTYATKGMNAGQEAPKERPPMLTARFAPHSWSGLLRKRNCSTRAVEYTATTKTIMRGQGFQDVPSRESQADRGRSKTNLNSDKTKESILPRTELNSSERPKQTNWRNV